MDVFGVIVIAALGVKIVDLLKQYLPAKIPTLPVSWTVGTALLFLGAATKIPFDVPGFGPIVDLNWAAKVFAGSGIMSIGSVGFVDYRRAVDSSLTSEPEEEVYGDE